MKNNKINAFTLSELLVVLVISSIVIALTFVILGLMQKQFSTTQSHFKDQQEIHFLERALIQDINTHQAFFNEKKDQLNLYGKDTVCYEFDKQYIIRKKDTFRLNVVEKQFLLDGKVVKKDWFDAMHLKFNQSYTAKNIFVFKKKDAAHYLNN